MTPPAAFQQSLTEGLAHHQAGRFAEAEARYRRVLQMQPSQPDALHLLGVLALQVGQHAVAVDLIRRAIGVNRRVATYHGNLGVALQALGRIEEAAASLKRSVEIEPTYLDGHFNLGVALQVLGRHAEAAESYRRAVALAPGHLGARYNLGNALLDLGRHQQAADAFRAVLATAPGHVSAQIGLGVALQVLGHADEALAAFTAAATLSPDDATAHTNLGTLLRLTGRPAEAIAHLERAVALAPDREEIWRSLGSARVESGDALGALADGERAVVLAPTSPQVHYDVGAVLHTLGRAAEAVACFERALALNPTLTDAELGLGVIAQNSGRFDEAVARYERVVALQPEHAGAHNNLANTLLLVGRLDDAMVHRRAERALRPENAASASNLLLARQYDPSIDRAALAADARAWNEQFAAPLAADARPHQHGRSPDRRLRIGYVSADFRRHPVGYFLEPILRHHDSAHVELYCYAGNDSEDDLTARLRASAQVWRPTVGLDDAALAEQIRADGIDILVDLSGHTSGNRLLTFARKPAPVQVSWLGYVDTTGLDAIDALIADAAFCPPDEEWSFAERVVRLPSVRWCYAGPEGAPPIAPLPALERGTVTFGCFNSLAKLTPEVIALWADVLAAVPGSRLLLKSVGFESEQARVRYLGLFAARGIGPERIEIQGKSSHAEYLATYARVDIGLDPFPFNGGTVTAESLWMGVPQVTLYGDRPVGRMGAAQLGAIGLSALVARSQAEYVRIAADLAGDLPRLADLRAGLRDRLRASPLGDVPTFTRDLEAAYRELWRSWCARMETR
jgi:predicted O-linked N-acetylglucosamine transferase (SPINDLY family)